MFSPPHAGCQLCLPHIPQCPNKAGHSVSSRTITLLHKQNCVHIATSREPWQSVDVTLIMESGRHCRESLRIPKLWLRHELSQGQDTQPWHNSSRHPPPRLFQLERRRPVDFSLPTNSGQAEMGQTGFCNRVCLVSGPHRTLTRVPHLLVPAAPLYQEPQLLTQRRCSVAKTKSLTEGPGAA